MKLLKGVEKFLDRFNSKEWTRIDLTKLDSFSCVYGRALKKEHKLLLLIPLLYPEDNLREIEMEEK